MDFEWPWNFNFPPFFTLQPNPETRRKQTDLWCQLIVSYCEANKLSKVSINSFTNSKPFVNDQIRRSCNSELVDHILSELKKRGNLEWLDKNHQDALIKPLSASELARCISTWAISVGQSNGVCTIFEIIHGEDTEEQKFHGLDEKIIIEALKHLEKENKAQIMGDNEGVKFFLT